MINKKRLLIVGGTGFIGSHLVKLALAKGYDCTVLSLRGDSKNRQVNICYIQADLTKLDELNDVLRSREFDYVVNLAGYIDHSSLFSGGDNVVFSHFVGLLNLIGAINRKCLLGFVQVGSSDEYGDQPAPQNEAMRESPISAYSVAKAAGTHMLQMLYKTEKFPVVIVRIFLAYGEGQDEKRFLPQLILASLKNQTFKSTSGEQIRDFCHVEDICDGILSALNSNRAKGQVINLGSGIPVYVKSMINLVQKKIGLGASEFGKIPHRPGENMILYADILKAKSLLSWKPKISIDQGLERTINFYKNRI